MGKWFDIDKSGLADILEQRGKAFVVMELLSNALDAGATRVDISLESIPCSPYANLKVTDNSPEGWADLKDAYTICSKSRRAGEATKRGRYSLGEKLVLALCRSASIATMQGTVHFPEGGDRRLDNLKVRKTGTEFTGEVRINREELREINVEMDKFIPPAGVDVYYNEMLLYRPALLKAFQVKLPTVIGGEDKPLTRTTRLSLVEIFDGDGQGQILEMGIPVCEAKVPWKVNVEAKVPLNMERDNVTKAFREALQVAVLNEMSETLTAEQSTETWAAEAIEDSRATKEAVQTVIKQRFGERAVVAVPGDPQANAMAEAKGYAVIQGGSLSKKAWGNVRKHQLLETTSSVFPTPKPQPTQEIVFCPACKRPVIG